MKAGQVGVRVSGYQGVGGPGLAGWLADIW